MRYVLLLCWLETLLPLLVLGWNNDGPRDYNSNDGQQSELSGVHLPLYRRPQRFVVHSLCDVGNISHLLRREEMKYLRTSTAVQDNRIVRKWRHGDGGVDEYMFDSAGLDNNWYTIMKIGNPPQEIEVDIDMLSPDFHLITTSNGQGVKYDVFKSTSRQSSEEHAHPLCPISSELLTMNLPGGISSVRLDIPVCQPGQYSLQTLANSGAVLGLSPLGQLSTLSRLATPGLLTQLLDQGIIKHDIISLTLLDSKSGLLSLDGSIAPAIEEIKIRAEKELAYVGNPDRVKMEAEIQGAMAFAIPPGSTHEDHFKWTDVGSGAVAGWHMTLVTGVWVNGVKVLKNQPALFDINFPFILAPQGAIQTVYDAISGGRTLKSLLDAIGDENNESRNFYAFPCLNEIDIAFEIAGWRFPFGKSELREDAIHGPFGGRFSLGQVDVGANSTSSDGRQCTGYCVGIIVKSTVEMREDASKSAMRDVWVLGEPFFRGLGVAFDMGGKKGKTRVGMRIY